MILPSKPLHKHETITTTIRSIAHDPDNDLNAIEIETTIVISGNPDRERMNDEIKRHADRIGGITTS